MDLKKITSDTSEIAKNLPSIVQHWIEEGLNIDKTYSFILSNILVIALILLLVYITYFIANRVILKRIVGLLKKTKTSWDDILIEKKALRRLVQIVPALFLYFSAHLLPSEIAVWIQRIAKGYMIIIGIITLDSILNAGLIIYNQFSISRERPIKGYIQILQIFIYIIGGILFLSVIMQIQAWGMITGLGAMTAVLLLIFKDTILGLVASFQFVTNNMVHIGDWIQMDKYGADGDVIDITLNTVKVQNWDKTITTIPTYALVSDSFKNWRGMTEAGGRRVKRFIYIDVKSIKFCSNEMLDRLEKVQIIRDYIQTKRKEIEEYNTERSFEENDFSRRQLTNVGTFRAYVIQYLANHPKVKQEMTLLVRHLQPGEFGLPIEIYFFCNDISWANYEGIQADVFDYLLAVLPEFDLRVFQRPTGSDFSNYKTGSTIGIT